MQTLAVNAALIVWVVLLLLGPAIALGLRGRMTTAMLAAVTVLTMTAICLVTYVAALAGYGSLGPLRVCVVLLSIVLVFDVVQTIRLIRGVRAGRQTWPANPDLLAVPLGLFVGVWTIVPALLGLGRAGVRFGLVTGFNPDLANYVLESDNVADSGFRHDNHLANHLGSMNIAEFAHHLSYMGPTALMNLVSAATGLAGWQVAMATMGVAVSLSVIALWALVGAVWPTVRRGVASAVVVAAMASLSTYLVSLYFLGGVLALVSVATSLAGATMLGRPDVHRRIPGALAVVGGGALGIFSYGHLGLPIAGLLPIWSVLVAVLVGHRTRRKLLTILAWSVGSVAAALVLSAVAVPTALALVRQQVDVVVGFALPAMDPQTMLFWPPGFGQATSGPALAASWALAAAVVILGLTASWRHGMRESVIITAVLTLGCVAVSLACVVVYGPIRYQTWKMESFLLPLALVLCYPALSVLKFGRRRLGRSLMVLSVGVVLLSPALNWQKAVVTGQGRPQTALAASFLTPAGLVDLARSPVLAGLSSVNVRLGSGFETMAAGSILPTAVVILSSPSYYTPVTSPSTCTVTRRDMLAPGETAYTDLGGGYVLLRRPSVCAVQK
ncbi:hypothetical protein [Nakamurella sp. PAMC28650]|uniref:hypothetical protein n=1 Tax=Nakamurella sp. PAMC28650 TaxID=2762325 RepID=UPI00164D12D9|nr:hypothetical protein [Nakamurella sp. PAMC28650]QNK82827.1 hypothetical protein H7F38_09205 [Nakamurella sp. PAMC28650]